jgi:hypothetical protein
MPEQGKDDLSGNSSQEIPWHPDVETPYRGAGT